MFKNIHNRPENISDETIQKIDDLISQDDLAQDFLSLASEEDRQVLKEVCRAGIFLVLELKERKCSDDLILRLQFTAGSMSFDQNTWDVSLKILDDFDQGKLTETDLELESVDVIELN